MKNDSVASIVIAIVVKILLCIFLAAALISIGKSAYSFGYSVFSEETMGSPPGKKVAVTVTEDMSVKEIAELLKARELIQDVNVFRVQYLLSEYKGMLKAGSYVLNNAQTADEMLEILSGKDEEESETQE